MRMLLNVQIPHNEFNKAVRDGSINDKLERILNETKAESVYFTEQNGHRGAILIVNVEDPSQVPHYAEPWFLLFNANVEFHIVMDPKELQKANIQELANKWTREYATEMS